VIVRAVKASVSGVIREGRSIDDVDGQGASKLEPHEPHTRRISRETEF
jgi:hypothetical protein